MALRIIPLNIGQICIIENGQWLEDDLIDKFFILLGRCSLYRLRSTLLLQTPQLIPTVLEHLEHIQILHSCDGSKQQLDGHWICTYYDTQSIYIYDSLNQITLKRQRLSH